MSSIRRQINVACTPRAVWRALSTAEGWTSWYADEARVDPRKGGRITLITIGDDGEPVDEVGIFHTFRPIRKLEVSWDASSPAPTRGTSLSFQVARDGDETRLALVHSGGGILKDEEARAALVKEWRQAFLALRDYLESE
jgi:uncharacterized protein YndB with AHSA1/START domain